MTAQRQPPQRLQLSRKRGYKKPAGAVVVSRPSKWGNPFEAYKSNGRQHRVRMRVLADGRLPGRISPTPRHYNSREDAVREAVAGFRKSLLLGYLGYTVDDVMRELAGKDLACWCPIGSPCHADVLLDLANNVPSRAEDV